MNLLICFGLSQHAIFTLTSIVPLLQFLDDETEVKNVNERISKRNRNHDWEIVAYETTIREPSAWRFINNCWDNSCVNKFDDTKLESNRQIVGCMSFMVLIQGKLSNNQSQRLVSCDNNEGAEEREESNCAFWNILSLFDLCFSDVNTPKDTEANTNDERCCQIS